MISLVRPTTDRIRSSFFFALKSEKVFPIVYHSGIVLKRGSLLKCADWQSLIEQLEILTELRLAKVV